MKWLKKHWKKLIALVAICFLIFFCWAAIACWANLGGGFLVTGLGTTGANLAAGLGALAAGYMLAPEETGEYVNRVAEGVGDVASKVAEGVGKVAAKIGEGAGKTVGAFLGEYKWAFFALGGFILYKMILGDKNDS